MNLMSAKSASLVPSHWSPEPALAFFERLHAMREALQATYGLQVQHASGDQLGPE
jgi:hypothetical protein